MEEFIIIIFYLLIDSSRVYVEFSNMEEFSLHLVRFFAAVNITRKIHTPISSIHFFLLKLIWLCHTLYLILNSSSPLSLPLMEIIVFLKENKFIVLLHIYFSSKIWWGVGGGLSKILGKYLRWSSMLYICAIYPKLAHQVSTIICINYSFHVWVYQ